MTIKLTTVIKLLAFAALVYSLYDTRQYEHATRTGIEQLFAQSQVSRQ